MPRTHQHKVTVRWTGNLGSGTSGVRDYERSHDVLADGHPSIAGTSDPAFRGARDRWTPEQLLVAALAQCHMLWFLNLAALAGVIVTDYEDSPVGTMVEHQDGSGEFTEVILRPHVTVAHGSVTDVLAALHHRAHEKCFIARSVNFPVVHDPRVSAEAARSGGAATA